VASAYAPVADLAVAPHQQRVDMFVADVLLHHPRCPEVSGCIQLTHVTFVERWSDSSPGSDMSGICRSVLLGSHVVEFGVCGDLGLW